MIDRLLSRPPALLAQAGRTRTLEPRRLFSLNAAAGEVTFADLPAKWRFEELVAYDASATPVAATVGLFTATGGGGTTLVAATTLPTLTAPAKMVSLAPAAIATTDYQTANTVFLRNVAAQGSALTVSFALTIRDLT